MHAAAAACVHYLEGEKSINRLGGKCHSGLARLEISKIYACCRGSMRRKTTSLTVLSVYNPNVQSMLPVLISLLEVVVEMGFCVIFCLIFQILVVLPVVL